MGACIALMKKLETAHEQQILSWKPCYRGSPVIPASKVLLACQCSNSKLLLLGVTLLHRLKRNMPFLLTTPIAHFVARASCTLRRYQQLTATL